MNIMDCSDKIQFKGEKNPSKMNHVKVKEHQVRTEAVYSEPAIERAVLEHPAQMQRRAATGRALWEKGRVRNPSIAGCWHVEAAGG